MSKESKIDKVLVALTRIGKIDEERSVLVRTLQEVLGMSTGSANSEIVKAAKGYRDMYFSYKNFVDESERTGESS